MLCLKYRFLFTLIVLFAFGCKDGTTGSETSEAEEPSGPPLFTLLTPEKTNISFNNTLTENPYANIISYQYFYNGGGVAIGDLNKDGLQDVYFTGNQEPNRLYLNKGKMKFEDVTAFSGVRGLPNTWKTGAVIADVNGDSLPDIYQCYSGNLQGSSRMNQLFINQGVDKNGIPTFFDQAKEYGLADSAFSTHAAFFDYDRDGDLDMFLLNQNPRHLVTLMMLQLRKYGKSPSQICGRNYTRTTGANLWMYRIRRV